MRNTKFTPGPWAFVEEDDGVDKTWTIHMDESYAQMSNEQNYPWVPSNKADWHLIASAPDLYEALEEISQMVSHESMDISFKGEIHSLISEALSKARGES